MWGALFLLGLMAYVSFVVFHKTRDFFHPLLYVSIIYIAKYLLPLIFQLLDKRVMYIPVGELSGLSDISLEIIFYQYASMVVSFAVATIYYNRLRFRNTLVFDVNNIVLIRLFLSFGMVGLIGLLYLWSLFPNGIYANMSGFGWANHLRNHFVEIFGFIALAHYRTRKIAIIIILFAIFMKIFASNRAGQTMTLLFGMLIVLYKTPIIKITYKKAVVFILTSFLALFLLKYHDWSGELFHDIEEMVKHFIMFDLGRSEHLMASLYYLKGEGLPISYLLLWFPYGSYFPVLSDTIAFYGSSYVELVYFGERISDVGGNAFSNIGEKYHVFGPYISIVYNFITWWLMARIYILVKDSMFLGYQNNVIIGLYAVFWMQNITSTFVYLQGMVFLILMLLVIGKVKMVKYRSN